MRQQYQSSSRSPSNSLPRPLFQCQGVLALHVADLADAQRATADIHGTTMTAQIPHFIDGQRSLCRC